MKKFDDYFPPDESDNESVELECIRQKLLQQRAEPSNDDNDEEYFSISSNSSEELHDSPLKDSAALVKEALNAGCTSGTAAQAYVTRSYQKDAKRSVTGECNANKTRDEDDKALPRLQVQNPISLLLPCKTPAIKPNFSEMNKIAVKGSRFFSTPSETSPTIGVSTKSFRSDSSNNVSPSSDYASDDTKETCRKTNGRYIDNDYEFPEFDEHDLVALDRLLDPKADDTTKNSFAYTAETTEQDEPCEYEDNEENEKDTLSDDGSSHLSKNDDGFDIDISHVPKIPLIQASNVDAFGFEVDPTDEFFDSSINTKQGQQDKFTVNEGDVGEVVGFSSERNVLQMESNKEERQSEIDPSYYEPRPREEIQDPIVHNFSMRNRPLHTRKMLPVRDVFDGTVSKLWQNKFDTFNQLQSEMANILAYSDDNVIVSAPTGAGKTVVFEMAMARFFAVDLHASTSTSSDKCISKRRKIVYISPSKALCEERFEDWSNRLAAMNLGIEIAVITGDQDPGEAFGDLSSAHFILTTPEKWDSLTRRWTEKFFLFASVKLILVDEVHLIADEARGCCLEAIICRMKTIQQAARNVRVTKDDILRSSYANTAPDAVNSLVRFIAVSATLPNISEVATFFDANEAYTFDESYRPVPLTTHVIGQGKAKGNSSSEFHFWKNLDRNVPEIIVRFSNQRAAIVFCHSKLDCEKLADLLATTHNIGRRDNATSSLAPQTRVSKLQRVLLYGIGYHHAGLELDDRRLVEKAFLNGTIRVLCATSTLALGVNLPAHLVVIKGTKAWRGGAGYQDLDQATLLQMIGRAGRPGFDSTGTAVIMTDNDSKHKFETLASSGLPSARSQCKEDKLIVMMNTEISQQVITSIRDSLNWIRSTLFYVQLTHKPEAHGKRVESNHATDDFIMQLCTSAIQKLQSIGAVIVGGKGKITPLAASHVMSQHLVDFQVMKQIFLLPHDTSQAQILKTLAHIESLQRPVRRSEKKTLNAAHKTLKKYKLEGPASKVRVKEPWEKSFVLLQAHIEDIPIDDYAMRQEMNSMVDYATRMLSAIEEHAIQGSRNGNIIVQCLLIRRAFAVHLWAANDGSLLKQIQGISGSLAFQLQMNGIFNFEDVMKNPIDKIEKAANRQSPFGAELKQACEQIIASRLKISTASIINIEDEGPGHAIECRIDRVCPIQDSGEYESNESNSNPTVIYTLVAYTDQPGGCILFESKISSPATYNAPLPSYFRKITVRLIASIVGLDDIYELRSHEDRTSPPVVISQRTKQNRRLPTKSCDENPNMCIPTSSWSRMRNTRDTQESPKESVSTVGFTSTGLASSRSVVAVTPKSVMSQNVQNHATKKFPWHIHSSLQEQTPMSRFQAQTQPSERQLSTHSESPNWHPTNSTIRQPVNQHSFRGQKEEQKQGNYLKRLSVSISTDTASRFTSGATSWKRAKRQQQQSQQRAFVKKQDNPFSRYQHDPNDSESYLDVLASQNNKYEVIPQEDLDVLLHKKNMPNFHQPRMYATNGNHHHQIVPHHRPNTFVSSHDILVPNSLHPCVPSANMAPHYEWPEHAYVSHRPTPPLDHNYPSTSKLQSSFFAPNRTDSLRDLRPTYEMYEPSRAYARSVVPNHSHEASAYHQRPLSDSQYPRSWISTPDIPQTATLVPPNTRELHGVRNARRHFYHLGMDEDDIQATFF